MKEYQPSHPLNNLPKSTAINSGVSVVLPVFNSADYLELSLNSILQQTYENFEVVAIDDGSTDSSLAILKKYEKKYKNLILHCNSKNLGLPETLNYAISNLCQYHLIARMDADDIADPRRLELQVDYLDKHPEIGLLGTNFSFLGRYNKLDKPVVLPEHHADIFKDLKICRICHPTVMFRKTLFVEAGGYRKAFRNAEDFDLWLRLSQLTQVANLPHCLLKYRLSVNGITTNKQKEMIFYHWLAIKSYENPHTNLDDLKREMADPIAIKKREYQVIDHETSLLILYFRLGWLGLGFKIFFAFIRKNGLLYFSKIGVSFLAKVAKKIRSLVKFHPY